MGFEELVAFTAKTRFIEHYQKAFGVKQMSGQRMWATTEAAQQGCFQTQLLHLFPNICWQYVVE